MAKAEFKEDLMRDMQLLLASLNGGGLEGMRTVAMLMPEFKGPDMLDAYCVWFSAPERLAYRHEVALALVKYSGVNGS